MAAEPRAPVTWGAVCAAVGPRPRHITLHNQRLVLYTIPLSVGTRPGIQALKLMSPTAQSIDSASVLIRFHPTPQQPAYVAIAYTRTALGEGVAVLEKKLRLADAPPALTTSGLLRKLLGLVTPDMVSVVVGHGS